MYPKTKQRQLFSRHNYFNVLISSYINVKQNIFATTNNPEESVIKQFKLIYTENKRGTMGRMCDHVHDYSSTKVNIPFALVAARDKYYY